MKQKLCLALLSCLTLNSFIHAVAPYYSIRSQSVDLARQLVGVRDIEEDLRYSDDCWPGYLGVTLEYSKSFNAHGISQCLFGDCLLNNGCCQAIKISGSGVENRANGDWLADYFGLPTNYQGVLNFNPRISNVIGDFQGYLRLDRYLHGLYFYIHAPVVHTKWNLNVCEDVLVNGGSYVEGYFAPTAIANENLVKTAGDFLSGRVSPNLGDDITFNKLGYGRFDTGNCCSRTETALADLRFWLGYDWLNCDCYGFGLGIVVAAPTGNAPEGRYLFEPIAGNGKHWEAGIMAKGDYTFWENCDGTHRVTGFTQANITHLFNSQQCRTFDLCGKPNSRYMLAQKLGPNTTEPFLQGSTTESAGQSVDQLCPDNTDLENLTVSNAKFAGEFTSVANLTTFCVDVSSNVQIDWVAMATYSRCNLTWDVGYELWYRGCEKITPKDCSINNLIPANTWALKGDAHVYGFSACTDLNSPLPCPDSMALGATESGATIKKGTNTGMTNPEINPGIDSPYFAYAGDAVGDFSARLDASTGGCSDAPISDSADNPIHTSIQPVFIKSTNIDFCAARTKGLSNKIFTHVSYYWDCKCWQPFFGFGAMGEFGSNPSKDCKSSCNNKDDCQKCSLSQWGVWLKGGFVFG